MAGDYERGDDLVEGGENLTQREMGEGEERLVDVDEEGRPETESTPHEGEEGTEPV
jgi:hypothetical protein